MKNILLVLFSTIIFTCCSSNEHPGLKNIMYMDIKGCLHVDRNCQNLKNNYAALYIDVKDLKENRLKCTTCVSDNDSRKIDSIIAYNRLKSAYISMKDNGYEVPNSFKTFIRLIKNNEYNQWVYESCSHIDIFSNLGTYDDFKNNLKLIP